MAASLATVAQTFKSVGLGQLYRMSSHGYNPLSLPQCFCLVQTPEAWRFLTLYLVSQEEQGPLKHEQLVGCVVHGLRGEDRSYTDSSPTH